MKIDFNEKHISIDELFDLLIENDYTEDFTNLIIENLTPLKIFLAELDNTSINIKNIEIFKYNNKLKLGFRLELENLLEFIENKEYLNIYDDLVYFLDSIQYSKLLYNYNKDITPYIKPKKINPLNIEKD